MSLQKRFISIAYPYYLTFWHILVFRVLEVLGVTFALDSCCLPYSSSMSIFLFMGVSIPLFYHLFSLNSVS